MFSERTRFTLETNRIAAAVAARRAAGQPLADLTETNPTAVGLQAPADVLALLADPGGLRYEPRALGLASAREAVAADFARRGARVEPGRVVLAASSSEAYGWLFKLLCDPGDDVLVPRPSYPLFEHLARLEGVRVEDYPLRYDGEWHLSLGEVERAIGPRTRALVAVSPNNPTGSCLSAAELARVETLCAERGLALVSDEVFADYPLAARGEAAPSAARGGPCLSFTLGGLSKSCGLPQLKLGWLAVAGPERTVATALERLELIADTYLSVATPVQLALPALLARRAELQRPILERVPQPRGAAGGAHGGPPGDPAARRGRLVGDRARSGDAARGGPRAAADRTRDTRPPWLLLRHRGGGPPRAQPAPRARALRRGRRGDRLRRRGISRP
jgi:aspartate/methionine/tyrosine aminotransferase